MDPLLGDGLLNESWICFKPPLPEHNSLPFIAENKLHV